MKTKPSFIKVIFDSDRSFLCQYLDLPAFDHPWHFHPEIELTLIIESSGIRYVGNHTSRFSAGDLVLLGPDLPHLWQNDNGHIANSNTRSRAMVLHFSKEFLTYVFRNAPELKALAKLFELSERGVSFPEKISDQAAILMFEINQKKGLQKWITTFELLHLLTENKEYDLLTTPGYHPKLTIKDKDIMNEIFSYVRNNLENKIELDDVAAIACLSKPAFCRYFKKKTTKSFFTFLNEYKIGNAKRMLHENMRLSIGSIGARSGFPSVQHFNSKFKELNGITPSQYRKKWKK